MKYNFDEIINRRNTNSIKYDFATERGMPEDVLPLWVADMDFRTAPAIIDKIIKNVEHGIFGYSDSKEEYYTALFNWFNKNFDWQIKRDWLVKTPGVVFAISAAIRGYTNEGESVLIQEPVYYPFRTVITENNRKVINNPLVLKDGHYEINFEEFEEKIVENKVKIFLLCSPHNPVGRVWKEWELKKIGDICRENQVIVVSDEIHCDFVYEGHKHIIFTNVDKTFEEFTLICTAPSKTFNMPGLQASNILIPNDVLRRGFIKAVKQTGYSQINMIGLSACEAAYKHGGDWIKELNLYLKSNLEFVKIFLKENLPEVKLIEPEGTYLLWLDFRGLKLSNKQRDDLIINKAKLWLSKGETFGMGGEGFERINIACPRSVLKEALESLQIAFSTLNNTDFVV